MWDTAVNAVLPIVLLILLGYRLKQRGFLNDNFVSIGNKLVFSICLPCMLFVNVYEIESFSAIRWDVVIYAVAMIAAVFLLGLAAGVAVTKAAERRGVHPDGHGASGCIGYAKKLTWIWRNYSFFCVLPAINVGLCPVDF